MYVSKRALIYDLNHRVGDREPRGYSRAAGYYTKHHIPTKQGSVSS